MRTLGLLAGAALALAACAGSAATEPLTISEITGRGRPAAVGSREAVAYWQGLSADLETAHRRPVRRPARPARQAHHRRRRRDVR